MNSSSKVFSRQVQPVSLAWKHIVRSINYPSASRYQRNNGKHCRLLEKQTNYRDVTSSITRGFTSNSKIVERKLAAEYAGVCSLVKRSGAGNIQQLINGSHQSTHFLHTSSSSRNQTGGGDKKPKDDKEKNKLSATLSKALLWMLTGYMFIAIISMLFPGSNQAETVRYVSWNEFVHHMLAKGEVAEVIVRPDIDIVTILLHDGAIVKGRKMEHKTFQMNIADIQKFEEKIHMAEDRLGIPPDQRVPVVYERGTDTAGKLLTSLIVVAVLISLLSKSKSIRSTFSSENFMQMGRAKFTLIDPLMGGSKGVRFSDVAGLKEAKQEVLEFVDYLKRPEHYKRLGAKVPKGALLLGPPGCGKTFLAKAVATEASVPFLSMNGSEFVEMIGGLGAARVRDLFKEARKRSPCIIYIDEIDAIGRQRSEGGGSFDGASGESEQTLNQLLVEMDGMATKEGVLMLASTNRADVLDKALLRPGRFDRHIIIDLPNMDERREIFEHHLKSIKLEHPPQYYSRRMAALTPGFSGADIANVCNESALHAAREKAKIVMGHDLEYAIERVVGGTEKRSQVIAPAEKRVVAYHESGHALIGWLLPHTDALLKITIVPRTNHALGFAQYTPTDKKLYSTEELFERMCMALGGRVAESITFNKVTTGAQNDLQKVTKIAYAQVRSYGMNRVLGPMSFPEGESKDVGKRPYSKKLANTIDEEARHLIFQAYKRTEDVLFKNKDKLAQVAEALLLKETLNYAEVEAIIGPPPHGPKHKIDPLQFESIINEQAGFQPGRSPPPPSEKLEE